MKILNKKMTVAGFANYIQNMKVRFWHRKIDKLVYHHTSSSPDIWRGSASMLHYWNLYRSRGYKTGPHIFLAPDGIWLFTPILKQGQHAGRLGNKGSIGIEIVGKYDAKPPVDEDFCRMIAIVTKILMKKFSIKKVQSHLEYDVLAFCSQAITGDWVLANMEKFMNEKKDVL